MNKTVVVLAMLFSISTVLSSAHATVSTDPYLVWQGDKEKMHVWRVQIEIAVRNSSGAGTDDDVFVQLNGYNVTVLDKPGIDDLEPNSVRTYELLLDKLERLQDIDFLRIQSTGTDKLDISYLYLKVNNRTIYYLTSSMLNPTTGTPYLHPIDQGHPLYIPSIVLRPSSEWTRYTVPPRPKVIGVSEIYNRIVSVVATKYLHKPGFQGIAIAESTNFDWNGPIKLYPSGNDRLRVYVPWKLDVGGTITAAEWFEFGFSCSKPGSEYAGTMKVNKQAGSSWNAFDGDAVGAEIQRALGGLMGWGRDIYGVLAFAPYYYEVPYPCQSIHLELNGQLRIDYDIVLWSPEVGQGLLSYETVLPQNQTAECLNCNSGAIASYGTRSRDFSETAVYVIRPGYSCDASGTMIYDCAINCVEAKKAQSWVGDGYCDDGTYGMDLTCSAFNHDAGDCS